jgi:MoxR-like ATPase
MSPDPHRFTFVGRGTTAQLADRVALINPWNGTIGPWRPQRGHPGLAEGRDQPNHPANYRASQALADAVNTMLDLSKPLLLTGNPGTGKSQLAERIAWEFNLGPVLRFEAQSISEANDLFYRFDLVGHLAALEMYKAASRHDSHGTLGEQVRDEVPLAHRFVKLGPLGEAIVRSAPLQHRLLFDAVFGPGEQAATSSARPSVVLIDEIDKASRDFPNDLLNGIERLEFRIRELGLDVMKVAETHRPIVIITSNSERDLPAPFLRRCTFFHIADPTQEELRQIIAQRFFATPGSDGPTLPPLYRQVLEAFWSFREIHEDDLQYRPGTSELIDWTSALIRSDVDPSGDTRDAIDRLVRTASSVSKHKDDQVALRDFLTRLSSSPT